MSTYACNYDGLTHLIPSQYRVNFSRPVNDSLPYFVLRFALIQRRRVMGINEFGQRPHQDVKSIFVTNFIYVICLIVLVHDSGRMGD